MTEQAPSSSQRKDNKIRGLLKRSNFDVPPLRSLVDEVFYSTQGGPFNVRVLAHRVEQDPTLSERILAICGAPYYSGKTQIRSITQVIQRLGPTGFRSVALQAFLELDIYETTIWTEQLRQIKDYSLIIAHICRVISRYTKGEGDKAFMCGLLHRIGFSTGLIHLPFEDHRVEEIWHSLEISHGVFGKIVVSEWGLSEEIQDVVGNYGQMVINQDLNLLGATVIAAEEFARQLKFGIKPPRRPKHDVNLMMKDSAVRAFELLDIDQHNVDRILRDILDVLKQGLMLNIRQ